MSKNKITRLGHIPDGWGARKLRDGAEIGSGKSPVYTSTGVGTVDVIGSNGKIGSTHKVNFQSGIAVGRVGASGSVRRIKSPVWLSDNVLYVKPDPTVWDESFLYHALTRARLPALASRTAQPLLTQSNLGTIVLPVPSMNQQKRIAITLDSYYEAIERTEEVIVETEQLRAALLSELLTRGLPGYHTQWKNSPALGMMIPCSWQLVKLGEYALIGTGGTPNRSQARNWNGEIPWMVSGEINQTRVTSIMTYITDEGLNNSNARVFPAGTIMIAMSGQGSTRGKVALLEIDTSCNQSLAAIQTSDDLFNIFLFHLLRFYYGKLRRITGDGRTGLNLEILRNIHIPLPSLSEQRKIADTFDAVDNYISKLQNVVTSFNTLKLSVAERFFLHNVLRKTQI